MSDKRRELVCPLCGYEYENSVHLKNGTWVFEPMQNFFQGIETADLDGMICAEWDSKKLTLYVHPATLIENGPVDSLPPSGPGDWE